MDITLTLTESEAKRLRELLTPCYGSRTAQRLINRINEQLPVKQVRCYHCPTSWLANTPNIDTVISKHYAAAHHYSRDDYAEESAYNTAWSEVHKQLHCTKIGSHTH